MTGFVLHRERVKQHPSPSSPEGGPAGLLLPLPRSHLGSAALWMKAALGTTEHPCSTNSQAIVENGR